MRISLGLLGKCLLNEEKPGKWKVLMEDLTANGFNLVTCKSRTAEVHIDIDYAKDTPNLSSHFISGFGKRFLVRIEPSVVIPDSYSSKIEDCYDWIISTNKSLEKDSKVIIWQNGFISPYMLNFNFTQEGISQRKLAVGILNQNKFSFIRNSMYKTRQILAKKLAASGVNVHVGGRDWDISCWRQTKIQLSLFVKNLKFFKKIDMGEFHLPMQFNSRNLHLVGPVESELKFLNQFEWSLVVENEATYLSEKLFNALAAGTIPLYLGPTLDAYKIPRGIYFKVDPTNMGELISFLKTSTAKDRDTMRDQIQVFMNSNLAKDYWTIEAGILRLGGIIRTTCLPDLSFDS